MAPAAQKVIGRYRGLTPIQTPLDALGTLQKACIIYLSRDYGVFVVVMQ